MTSGDRHCCACGEALPQRAAFCPTCGAPAPTQASDVSAAWEDAEEREFRERLQRALGSAYQLRELLGRGGFGVVYAAWERGLEREVAVKALRHGLFPTQKLLDRFKREARVVAKLRHPNIVPVFAVGEGEGLAYMTMPRVTGESLRAVLEREGPMEVEPALRIAVGAARALHTAHAAGRSSPRRQTGESHAGGYRAARRPHGLRYRSCR